MIILCACTYGQHVRLAQGAVLHYRFNNVMGNSFIPDKLTTYRFEVLGRDDSGYYRIQCTLIAFTNSYSGQKSGSGDITAMELNNSGELMDLALLYQPFEIAVDDKGNVVRYKGIGEVITRKADEWLLKPEIKTQLLENAKSIINWQVQMAFPALPDNIAARETGWTNATSTLHYSVSGKKDNLLIIDYTNGSQDSTAKYIHQMTGQMQLDPASGKVIAVTQKDLSTGESTDRDGKNTPYRLEQLQSVELLTGDTPVAANQDRIINPMAKMSFWSTSLRNGPEYDSAKVYAFFKENDSANIHNRGYMLRKLGIIQATKTKNHYEIYDSLLRATPTYWLEGQYTHLHNKLQDILKDNADSAATIISYLRKSPSYNEWVQHSFSQAFMESDSLEQEIRKEMKKEGYSDEKINKQMEEYHHHNRVARQLLDKLVVDADTTTRNAVYPMSLWVAAKAKPADTALLRRAITQLDQLPASAAQQGNAQRYALLLYKQAYASRQAGLAAGLLDHTIARLEKQTLDSTNKERYEAQNMLAYAYNLKYEAVKASNKTAALGYLSKAAAYSPKGKKEMAYSSFYDRVFLNSKESYRADFANVLIAEGDKKQALKVLSEQVLADPTMIGEVKKAFNSNFPGRDFNTFFSEVITRAWKTAPDFTLKDLNGDKTYRLEDYKGRWLVLDFWGTWCAPCREEMPDNNKFAASIQQKPDIAFLAIACHDDAGAVKAYFANHQFDMPSVMSDNKVEKLYEITGYPSKIVISPDGRMLPLRFGSDWKKIIGEFATLSPKKKTAPAGNRLTNKVN